MCGHVVLDRRDDRLARAAGLHRRRHDPDRVRRRLTRSSRARAAPIVTPLIGLVATLAPTIGPTVGGYLTDAFSWHWLFFINIVPGHRRDASRLAADRFRPAGSVAVRQFRLGRPCCHGGVSRRARIRAGGRAAQRLVRGRTVSSTRAIVCGRRLALVLLARVHRRAADRRPHAPSPTAISRSAALFSFVLGIGLYGLTYLYPLYLAQIRGYYALMIGETMFVSALPCSSPRRSPAG